MWDLFHCDQEIVLLSTLNEEVLTVDQVAFFNDLVEGCELFLVEADATTLSHLAHLALRREALCGFCEEINRLGTDGLVAADFKLRYTFEYAEESGFVQFQKAVLGSLAEENVGSFECHFVVFAAVNPASHFLAQLLLKDTATWILTVFFDQSVDFVLFQRGEDLDVAFCFSITYVQPELVELVRSGVALVKPYVTLFGLKIGRASCRERV